MDDFLEKNYKIVIYFLIGIILVGIGVFFYRNGALTSGDTVEVLDSSTKAQTGTQDTTSEIVVEIAGAVTKPGVYNLSGNSRIDDLLIASNGVSDDADREWMQKNINRASRLIDGQKVYIKSQSEVLSASTSEGIKIDQGLSGETSGGLININTASLSQLDSLPGIGQVYGQKIIEQRPYSTLDELVSKGVVSKSVLEKIKNQITFN